MLHLHHHHLDRDDGVVDQKSEGDDQRAKRNALQIDAEYIHENENDGQHQRHRQRHDDSGAGAQRGETHQEHDNQRLDERPGEFADRFLDHSGLIGDLFDLYADWRLGAHLVDRESEILAKGEHIAAPRHHRADDDRRGAVMPRDKARRVFVAG